MELIWFEWLNIKKTGLRLKILWRSSQYSHLHYSTCQSVCTMLARTNWESEQRKEDVKRERETWTLRSIQVDKKITGASESTCEDEEFTSSGKTWVYSEQILLFYASRNFNYDTQAPTHYYLSVSHFKWIILLHFPPSVPWVVHG